MILLKPPPYVYHSWQRTVSSERKQAIGHQIPILPFPGTNSPCLSIPLGSREEATLYTIPFPPFFLLAPTKLSFIVSCLYQLLPPQSTRFLFLLFLFLTSFPSQPCLGQQSRLC